MLSDMTSATFGTPHDSAPALTSKASAHLVNIRVPSFLRSSSVSRTKCILLLQNSRSAGKDSLLFKHLMQRMHKPAVRSSVHVTGMAACIQHGAA